MGKFDPREHKRRQTHKALLALHYEDGFTYEFLAELACCPIGTFRSYVPQDYDSAKVPPSDVIDLLRERLAKEWGNYRLVHKDLPTTDSICHDAAPPVPDGLEDDIEDAGIALGDLITAKRSGDPDLVESASNRLFAVARETKSEALDMKAKKERVTADGQKVSVTVYGDGR